MGKMQYQCEQCNNIFVDYQFKHRRYCSKECNDASPHLHWLGKKHSPETIEKFKKIAEDKKDLISKGWFQQGHNKWDHPNVKKNWIKKGQKPKNWLGGKRTPSQTIKDSSKYKKWREAVFQRDNYTCVLCGSKKNLEPDHIYAKTKYPDKAYDVSNGRVLCRPCHKSTPNYGGKAIKYENPYIEL